MQIGEGRLLLKDFPWNKTVMMSRKCVSDAALKFSRRIKDIGRLRLCWNQPCGTTFQEQIIEYKQGAAQLLADSIDTRASIDTDRQAGSELCSESSASDSSTSTKRHCQRTSK